MAYLKGFTNLGDSTITNHIRENFIQFWDYGLLEKGNFDNVVIQTTGYYGGLEHVLQPVDDPRYTYGQVWEGFRSNWVWESGLGALNSTDNANPGVSGVTVNGTFYPASGAGSFAHHINHPLGRVIFDSAIDTTGNVSCEYSYKYINVTKVDGLGWFEEIQKRSERADNSNFPNSGDYAILADNRYQLPAIGIEIGSSRTMKPYQLGGGQSVFTDFLFHCVAEDGYTRDSLIDIVSLQHLKNMKAFDLNKIANTGTFPLDYRGVPVSGALRYPDLLEQHEGTNIRLEDVQMDSVYSLSSDIHVGTVKFTAETILFGV
jgi:hypothetical protein|tara:strand:+ start:729 stop:1679 length:951 start_codon:yes stop_codon:yes gene_type:complete